MRQRSGAIATVCPGGHSFKIGGLVMGGLSLPGLLEAEALAAANTGKTAATGSSAHKSVIMVYLSGGLAHQDTFDLKMDAPAGIRGEFKPIATRLPGVQVCELLPKNRGNHGQAGGDPIAGRSDR